MHAAETSFLAWGGGRRELIGTSASYSVDAFKFLHKYLYEKGRKGLVDPHTLRVPGANLSGLESHLNTRPTELSTIALSGHNLEGKPGTLGRALGCYEKGVKLPIRFVYPYLSA